MAHATPSAKALIVDDEKNIRTTLGVCLEGAGCRVTGTATGEAALAALRREPYDLAFLDLRLGDEDGLSLLPRLLAERPGLCVIVITAHASFDTAVEAIKRGAQDYLPKPFTPAQIRHAVRAWSERRALSRQVGELEAKLSEALPGVERETSSPAMRAALEVAARAAPAEVSVLLRGESGTGKGVLAQLIHAKSARAARPLVTVNCPTLSEDLLASELFGHARGAFTGAVRDQEGRVEAAEGGTLFLDEIGEITPPLQAKLLRFLQEKEFERVGEARTRRADVRVLAATNRDLEADVRAGRFREDLYYRLNVIEITLPPLRERRDDIARLARHFLSFFARAAKRPTPTLSRAAEDALSHYTWPGNIRELRNAMERAVILSPGAVLDAAAFPGKIAAAPPPGPQLGGDVTLDELEREHITRVVARAPTLDEAARILGIEPSTLWRKRKRYEAG